MKKSIKQHTFFMHGTHPSTTSRTPIWLAAKAALTAAVSSAGTAIGTVALLIAPLLASTSPVNAQITPTKTLAQLLMPGEEIQVGDKIFYDFHNFTELGDLTVGAANISVFGVLGGPGAAEDEFGIRFQSAQWSLRAHPESGFSYCLARRLSIRRDIQT